MIFTLFFAVIAALFALCFGIAIAVYYMLYTSVLSPEIVTIAALTAAVLAVIAIATDFKP